MEFRPAELHHPGDVEPSADLETAVRGGQYLAHLRLSDDPERNAAARDEPDFSARAVAKLPIPLGGRRVALRPQGFEAVQSEVRDVVRDGVACIQGGPSDHGGL